MSLNTSTILPPPPVEHLCIACRIGDALDSSVFCASCKMMSEKARRELTARIQIYEDTFNVGFRLLFKDDEAFFPEGSIDIDVSELNTIPTEEDIIQARSGINSTIPTFAIISTKVDDDGVLHYISSTTNTDDYLL